MPSYASLTIGLFGLTSFISGLFTLLSPSTTLSHLSLPVAATPALYGNGLAAFAMGVFYTLAAVQENRAFFKLSLCTRSLTTVVFWNVGGAWRGPAVWEGVGVLLTAVGLAVDSRARGSGRKR